MENNISKRRSLKGRVTRIENAITAQGTAPWDKRLVTGYLQQLDQYWQELHTIHEEIGFVCTDEQYQIHQTEYDQLATRIETQKLRLPELEEENRRSSSDTGARRGEAIASSNDNTVRLPRLELPTFSGNFHEWTSFHDLFTATINNNDRLAGAQKLQYLKASVRGEAAILIQSIQVTDSNFEEAWDILKCRYNNKREIINAYIRRLCSQQALSSEAPTALRKLIDVTNETVRALRVLQVPVDQWDIMLVYLVTEKLDQDSRRQWELTLKTDETVKFADLIEFLEQRARALITCGTGRSNRTNISPAERRPPMTSRSHHAGIAKDTCRLCKQNHPVYHCSELLQSSVEKRRQLVKEHSLCFNCLSSAHQSRWCKSSACRKCGGNHHTLLHLTTTTTQRPAAQNHESDTTTALHGKLQQGSKSLDQVLLATALVQIQDKEGNNQICRALLDSGSQASFVSEACAKRLGLPRQRTSVTVTGISAANVNTAKGIVELHLSSCVNQKSTLIVAALIIKKVTGILPSQYLDTTKWDHVPTKDLADPEYNFPNQVEVLLGAEVYSEVVQDGIRRGPQGTPIAQLSTLGWLISGRTNQQHAAVRVSTNFAEIGLHQSVQRFWELENVPESREWTNEETSCEEHFISTYTRDEDGRFTVRLPFKTQPVIIDSKESRTAAIKRLTQVERKLEQQPARHQEYTAFLEEYERLGHMELTTKAAAIDAGVIYLPHHSIIKETSTTTRLRVVFDASAKSSLGTSLNDHLMVGPTLQDDIFRILLRFRTHAVALIADINKMYRQIRVQEEDTRYQHIVWRTTPQQELRDYRLMTLTYGTASAPYLAVRCVRQLALEERENLPTAADATLRDFYVDDLMSGAESVGSAIQLQQQLVTLLGRGGFQLRKWVSSHPAVLKDVPYQLKEEGLQYSIDNDGSVKTLGLQWNPRTDHFYFWPNNLGRASINTKRTMLATLAKIYDPLGWLSPVTITGKIMLQQLWTTTCKWDEKLPANIEEKWKRFQDDLPRLKEINIPRRITQDNSTLLELHGFCDASEHAYAAAIYLKSVDSAGISSIRLIVAKTRVAPIKRTTIPRLELCSALLLSRLFKTVREIIQTPEESIHAWTDSTVALAWINSSSSRWKTFVANRVAIIQASVPPQHWKHVKGEHNPADCASRGIFPTDLSNHKLWWSGPEWLIQHVHHNESVTNNHVNDEMQEEVRNTHTTQIVTPFLIEKYSDLHRLTRTTAYLYRFIYNCRTPAANRQLGPLTSSELNKALLRWIKVSQSQEFAQEINSLTSQSPCSNKSQLATLSPFLDANGLIRVGWRLQNAKFEVERKHPIVLPHKHNITTLIIRQEHLRTLHGEPQLLLYSLQQRYWIVGGRKAVRQESKRWRQTVLAAKGPSSSNKIGKLATS